MRVVEVHSEAELAGLRSSWNNLLAQSPSDTVFLTWEWVSSWWTAYGTAGALNVVLAFDMDGTLQGIAPMYCQTVEARGLKYNRLAFIGDSSVDCDSDYLDFIIAAGHEDRVLKAFAAHWQVLLRRGTLLTLNRIPAESPNLAYLRAMGHRDGMILAESDDPCSAFWLPADWESYLKQLAPRFRTKVRSVVRGIAGRSELTMHFCNEANELGHVLPALFTLHQRRWAAAAKPGVFRSDAKRLFYRVVSPLLLEAGWLAMSWLDWKGQIIACQYGFVYRNRYFQLQEGYDPACEHLSVGVALRALSIQKLQQSGVSHYDFLGGNARHKNDWGAVGHLSKNVVIAAANARNVLYCRGPAWEARLRASLRRVAPKVILAARDARQQRRVQADFQRFESGAASTLVRGILASCYTHSPLPLLVMAVRKRYRLAAPAPERQRFSLRGRRGPSVRILYYHRVNDNQDPFFPAIPVARFEQEMRCLARRHTVVSLEEAVRRLTVGGPPEPVIAITFDDGYEDNYLNAFPILKRYGLPATILLATGSLDSREPLWFETLALALKKANLAFIDLDIDIPRRLWLRSVTERLQANDELYGILRQLPDIERRQWIDDILSRLHAREHRDRNGKMLTWEQVRVMNRSGISFGGHTVTHPFVSRLTREQARWEISECKRRIEEELQVPVKHFAYPSGRELDVCDWSKGLIHEVGYEAALSTMWGVNTPATDKMRLKRGNPWESRADVFAAKLDWYQLVDA